jgi:aminoglycoside 3-N-acetyltransferase
MTQKIEKAAVADGLAALGVERGDLLAMHTRVPALGRVAIELTKHGHEAMREGVHDLIDSVVQAVGPAGMLMVPTFSFCFVGRADTPPWHPRKAPSAVGWLTDELWRRPDAARSDHPTHSVGCIGPDAAGICTDHGFRTPLGLDTPFHRLALRRGKVCYFGTTGTTLSLLHVAEVVAGVPYVTVFNWGHVGWRSEALVERPDGSVATVPIDECPGCSENFGRFDVEAENEGLFREGRIYDAKVVVFSAFDALSLAVDRMKREPVFFLCPRGRCPACDTRWKAM